MKKILTLFIALILTGCSAGGFSSSSAEISLPKQSSPEVSETKIETSDEKEVEFSAWTVYWDNEDSEKEIEDLKENLDNVIHFAAYFDAENELFLPDKTTELFAKLKTNHSDLKCKHYISFVNDKINKDGSSSLKDTKLLAELFKDEKSMEEHAKEVLSIARRNGYDGVEIDYEAIRKNTALWNKFVKFIEILYAYTSQNGFELRVVLEPSAPLGEIKFPEGPEYVMMCYNLYDSGTTPGPKADKQFIKGLCKKMSAISGKKTFAFSTGGFDWEYDGDCTALTETAAAELALKYGKEPSRDEASGALYFSYYDDDEKLHEVWYADGKTIKTWAECVKQNGGGNISLWRLCGNDEESLKEIFE